MNAREIYPAQRASSIGYQDRVNGILVLTEKLKEAGLFLFLLVNFGILCIFKLENNTLLAILKLLLKRVIYQTTNRNMKWLVNCQYGSIVQSNVSSIGPSSDRSCFSLTKGQCSKRQTVLSALAVHQPFYISICISTLPTQHTTFIYQISCSCFILIPSFDLFLLPFSPSCFILPFLFL